MGSLKCGICFTPKFRWTEKGPPPDVAAAFDKYAAGSATMTADQLGRFLAEVQMEPNADADRIVDQVKHRMPVLTRPGLALKDFHHFLFSDELNPPITGQVHQDMTAPLSHYYIYTGYNSYLTADQPSSGCSDIPIINSLQNGVRVVELDMWPNSTKDNIDIIHGRTLTTPVDLIKCLKSIKEYAFVASPYPVIINLEDHLTPSLLAKVAKMVTETFGDMLYFPESDHLKQFPSPEALKRRIIISTKPPKEYLNAKEKNLDEAETSFVYREKEHDQNAEESDDDDHIMRQHLAPEYKRIITITEGKPRGPVRDALNVDPYKVRRVSLSELEFEKVAASHGDSVIRFTQKNLLRIYPKGLYVNSSNYNQLIGWMHGAQMVAFNMQGYGRSLWWMQGFFRANGGCGYVKKPHFLQNTGPHGEVFNPKTKLPANRILKVKVYMGDGWRIDFKSTYFDTYSPPELYTWVGIAGVPADCIMKKTKKIEDDWTPVWDEEFIFPLTVPELALLRIEVHEYDMSDKDDFGGQTCLPVSELRPGIRAVPLYNRKGVKYRSMRLLVRFEFLTD